MNTTEKNILDDMVAEVLKKVDFDPTKDDLASLYNMLAKELPI